MAERKKYIEVQVPLLYDSFRVLGTPEDINGKTIRIDMSRKMRGKGLVATFKISKCKEELIAVPIKFELTRPYLNKMMRKRVDYVEDSFLARCSDVSVIIKPFLITRKRVSRAVRKNLRNTAKEFIVEYLKERSYSQASQDVFNTTLQKTMLPKLKKVYPLAFCELRIFQTKEIEKVDINTLREYQRGESKNQEESKDKEEGEEKSEEEGDEAQEDD